MLTIGTIESKKSDTEFTVKLPLFDSSVYEEDVATAGACVCTLPQYDPNIKVGDTVVVGFLDYEESSPIIMGYLYKGKVDPTNPGSDKKDKTYADIVLDSLQVRTNSKLPFDTSIGQVNKNNIKCLEKLKYNAQGQMDLLYGNISEILSMIKNIEQQQSKVLSKLCSLHNIEYNPFDDFITLRELEEAGE